jgi:molecular chaperone GrpE
MTEVHGARNDGSAGCAGHVVFNVKGMEMKRHKEDKAEEAARGIGEKELEELRKKAAERDEYHNKWLNVHADYENARKRMEKERTDYLKFAHEDIVGQLFPIVDNFDMALAAMDKAEDKAAVMDGIKLVQKEFHRILDDNGVRKIETKGAMFDPNLHEAVAVVETDDVPDGQIVDEVRAGYTLNDRLLRPAQVRVAKNAVEEDEPQE